MNKILDEFKSLFLISIFGIVMIVGVYTIFTSVKNWISPPPKIRTYVSPTQIKPSRPVGLIYLLETGYKQDTAKWYLNADTLIGSRTKRLVWVKLDLSEKKDKEYSTIEQLFSLNCETMEMRILKKITTKKSDMFPFVEFEYPYEKADVVYPSPNTGWMGLFKEACKKTYDPNPNTPT
jgi:hypothetical protein